MNQDRLNFWMVEGGRAKLAEPTDSWDGINTILVAATTPLAASAIAVMYEADTVQPAPLMVRGKRVHCCFFRDLETAEYW